MSAAAIVETDLKTLKPTGVTVTCPGFGYDDNTTVTVDSWNGATSWPCTFELEEQVGGQLEAGFVLTGLYEDTNGEGRLHELGIPSFVATRAVLAG